MTEHLPSLRALQSFEAALRHGSFSAAARELNVTHGAVSRAVQALETHLGARLLVRGPSGVVPSAAGARLAAEVGPAFARLRVACRETRRAALARQVTLTLSTSLASKWLVPRLGAFQARHPDISLRLVTDDRPLDLDREGIDAALRYGAGPWDGYETRLAVREALLPVAAPSVLAAAGLPVSQAAAARLSAAQILSLPLLVDELHPGWRAWLGVAGSGVAAVPEGGSRFRDTAVLIAAALAGQGAALVRELLARDDLAAGRLLRLGTAELPLARGLCLLVPAGGGTSDALRRFESWLGEQLASAVGGSDPRPSGGQRGGQSLPRSGASRPV